MTQRTGSGRKAERWSARMRLFAFKVHIRAARGFLVTRARCDPSASFPFSFPRSIVWLVVFVCLKMRANALLANSHLEDNNAVQCCAVRYRLRNEERSRYDIWYALRYAPSSACAYRHKGTHVGSGRTLCPSPVTQNACARTHARTCPHHTGQATA